MKIITLDCETSGLAPYNADYKTQYNEFPRIVTLAYKINGEPVKEFLLNQEGVPIPEEATKIHGITDEMCAASEHFFLPVITAMIDEAEGNDFSVGHNIYFDSSTIKANLIRLINEGKASHDLYERLEKVLRKECRIDTMRSTTAYCNLPGKRGPKWPKLTELHFVLFGIEFVGAHGAGADVDACHKCFHECVARGIIVLPTPEPTNV